MVDRIIYHPVNRGKEAALRSGFAAATGDIILVQDADLEHNREVCPALLEPLMSGKADAIFRSGFKDVHHIASFFLAHGGQQIFETAFPLMKSIPLEEDRFDIEPEITAKLARAGCRIYEVGISYSGRTYAEGKKINWKDGVGAIYAILKYHLERRRA